MERITRWDNEGLYIARLNYSAAKYELEHEIKMGREGSAYAAALQAHITKMLTRTGSN